MKKRYSFYQRSEGVFYAVDHHQGSRFSLKTRDRQQAERLILAWNEAHQQPAFNREIARAYLAAADPEACSRTWQTVFEAVIALKTGPTRTRWLAAAKQSAFRPLLTRPLLETRAEHFLEVLADGRASPNVFLRRLHNFALDVGWLLNPVLNRRQWPQPPHRERRAITEEEHRRILDREHNPEWNLFYQVWRQANLANCRN